MSSYGFQDEESPNDYEDDYNEGQSFSSRRIALLVLLNLAVAGAVGGIAYSAVVKQQPEPTMSPTLSPTPIATLIQETFQTSFETTIKDTEVLIPPKDKLIVRNGKL